MYVVVRGRAPQIHPRAAEQRFPAVDLQRSQFAGAAGESSREVRSRHGDPLLQLPHLQFSGGNFDRPFPQLASQRQLDGSYLVPGLGP